MSEVIASPLVRFHYNVPDRMAYVCDMLRKAARRRLGASVVAPPEILALISRRLWTCDDQAFIPHRIVPGGGGRLPADELDAIWLVQALADQPRCQPVVINLTDQPLVELEGANTLVEVVPLDADERDAGRRRWKQYASQGWKVEPVDALAGADS